MAMQPTPTKSYYFREAEFTFLVEHQDNLTAEAIIQRLKNEFNDTNFSDENGALKLARVYTFDRSASRQSKGHSTRYFSLVFGDVPDASIAAKAGTDADVSRSNELLLNGITNMGGKIATLKTQFAAMQAGTDAPSGEFRIEAVSPNWYSTGAQAKPIGGGGPGAWPVAASAPPQNKSSIEVTGLNGRGQNQASGKVEILVLDTAPSDVRLNGSAGKPAHTFKVTRAGDIKPHLGDLMQELNDHLLGADIEGHQYDMADHGLFVSFVADGVLNKHLPSTIDASIHLIEVLNTWGVGTVETIVAGLHKAYQIAADDPSTPRIINCSFMLLTPRRFTDSVARTADKNAKGRLGHRLPADDNVLINAATRAKMAGMVKEDANGDASSSIIMRMIFDLLDNMGVLVVAASGNDAEAIDARPVARYPAAYKSVIGVAALSKTGVTTTPALYSNRADEQQSQAFATYGGDVKPITTANGIEMVTDDTNALVGPYTAEKMPDPTIPDKNNWPPNTKYWVRWAGTSFAAPIISATLAVLRAYGEDPQKAVNTMRGFQNNLQTAEQEEVVPVEV